MKPEGPQILNTITPQTRIVRLPVPLFWRKWPWTLALVLVMSIIAPLMLLVPFPVAMAYLRFRKGDVLKLGGCTSLALGALAAFHITSWALVVIWGIAWGVGYYLATIVRLNFHPAKALLRTGITLGIVVLGGAAIYLWPQPELLEQNLLQIWQSMMQAQAAAFASAADAARWQEMMAAIKPEQLAHQVVQKLPALIFGVCFASLWPSTWFLLRHKFWWQFRHPYRYQVTDLLAWRNPDFLLVPVFLGLILAVVGKKLTPWAENAGFNLLYILSFFYVLQMFGVGLAFLRYWRLGNGFLRALLMILLTIQAWPVMALLGLSDCWINFRRFLKPINQNKLPDKEK